jgi:hypothetical protein
MQQSLRRCRRQFSGSSEHVSVAVPYRQDNLLSNSEKDRVAVPYRYDTPSEEVAALEAVRYYTTDYSR